MTLHYVLCKQKIRSMMTVNYLSRLTRHFCTFATLIRGASTFQLDKIIFNNLSNTRSSPRSMTLSSSPRIRNSFPPVAYIALCDFALVAHCNHLRTQNSPTNFFQYSPSRRQRLARNHSTLHSAAPQDRDPTLMFIFLGAWALWDNMFTSTLLTLPLVGHGKPTPASAISILSPTPHLPS